MDRFSVIKKSISNNYARLESIDKAIRGFPGALTLAIRKELGVENCVSEYASKLYNVETHCVDLYSWAYDNNGKRTITRISGYSSEDFIIIDNDHYECIIGCWFDENEVGIPLFISIVVVIDDISERSIKFSIDKSNERFSIEPINDMLSYGKAAKEVVDALEYFAQNPFEKTGFRGPFGFGGGTSLRR